MKVYKARHAAPTKREYFKGSPVSPEQADAIRTLGGRLTTEPDERAIWRIGS